MHKFIIGLLLFFCNNLLYATDTFPPLFTADYTLYAKGFPMGEGTRSLKMRPDGAFVFESLGETSGLVSLFKKIYIEERTVFTRKDGKIRPLEYTYRQTGYKSRLNTISFDWMKQVAIHTFKNQTKKFSLEEGTLDKLLYQVVLMEELKQGKRELEYKVVRKGKIKIYKPTLLGEEKVDTGIGSLKTLKYERYSTNQKRHTTLWCAPNLHYLPVQVEHVEPDGDVFSMVLRSVRGLSE
jgi:hypothetical protein